MVKHSGTDGVHGYSGEMLGVEARKQYYAIRRDIAPNMTTVSLALSRPIISHTYNVVNRERA